jgi:hypothetical protein
MARIEQLIGFGQPIKELGKIALGERMEGQPRLI